MNSTDEFKRLSFGGRGAADDIFAIFGVEKEQLEKYTEANRLISIADGISNIYIWVVFAFGVPGNILTIITVLTIQPIGPMTFFVAVLACLDAASLVGKLTAHQLVRHRIYIGNIGCKFQFLTVCTGTLANWVLLLICAERFFTIYSPEKKKIIFTKRNCYIVVTIMALTFLAFFAGVSGAMRGADTSGLRCGTYNEYLWFWTKIWFWINSALYLFLPCLCIVPMVGFMIRRLCVHNRKEITQRVKDVEVTTDSTGAVQVSLTDAELANKESGFTLMVIIVALLFLILSIPACVYFLSYRRSDDALTEAKWALFEQIQFVLVDSRHAINSFVYFLSARRFRMHLISLLLCKTRLSHDHEDAQVSTIV